MNRHHRSATLVFIVGLAAAQVAAAQQVEDARNEATTQTQEEMAGNTVWGTVVSSTAETLVVRLEGSDTPYQLFTIEDGTTMPETLEPGTSVRVRFRTNDAEDDDGADFLTATEVVVEEAAESTTPETPAEPQQPSPTNGQDPVPEQVRDVEGQIAREVERYRGGIRGGFGLEPELLAVGAHARLGPFFHEDVWFRPNFEFAFGEVTTLFALNLETVYTLPITQQQNPWSFYIGAGPGFTLGRESFEDADEDVDVSDFVGDASFNLLAGLQHRGGWFVELKGIAYAEPNVRVLLGFNF